MRQITKINFSGKWVEFWFDAVPSKTVDNREWHDCCKSYMLWECVNQAELNQRVSNHGFVGLCCVWPYGADRPESIHESWARFGTEGVD